MNAPDEASLAGEAESPHAAVWDMLPSAVLLMAPGGEALHISRAFSQLTSFARDNALGRGWGDLLAEESRHEMLRLLAQRADFSLQLRVMGTAEDPGWIDCRAHWLEQAGHYVCVLHDVTLGKQAELAAHAKAQQFRLLADSVPLLIAYYEAKGFRCLFANKQYAQAFGRDEHSILGLSFPEIIGEEAAREIQPHVDRMLQQREAVSYERQKREADGSVRWIEVNLLPHLSAGGELSAAFVLISDISKYRHAEQARRESEERLAKFMQASAEGIVFHRDGYITDANPPLCQLVGYALPELIGRRTLAFVAPEETAKVAAAIGSGRETSYESALVHRDGTRIPVEFIVRSMSFNGEPTRMTIVRDIRDRQAAQARIHHLAHHDALTGLPNRMAFIERLEHLTRSARAGEAQLALLFIDLDHFKRVNDSLGHLAGDRLLQNVAARISACVRATDLVARFGGDEFLVLLVGMTGRRQVEEVARKLLLSVEAPIEIEGRPISVSPSVGIALCPEHGESPNELIKYADAAMYLAKSRGRANFQFFSPGMGLAAYSALVMEGELAQALERGEFVLHYQPQVRAADGSIVGIEALIRWNHPTRGLLLPDEFIPLSEQRRLMLSIGRWVLLEAARCARHWQQTAGADTPVAVNLTSMQFHAPGFVEIVANVLRETGLPGHLLELELTERMLMADLASVKAMLLQLKALGIRISVDDFGTGYSSLGHLKELPIDKMKIDRSFVHDLPGERDSAAITRAIIQMGRSLGITVIAEGIENEAQRAFLAHEGCDELQGNFIGGPVPCEALGAWFE